SNKNSITKRSNMEELEELDLLKMDCLNLRTLTGVKDAITLRERKHGKKIDFSFITFDDTEIFKMFEKGETLGIFQFESGGMRQFLKELEPDNFENIIAANSLFRPGPMDQIPIYIKNKNAPENIEYDHE